MNNSIADTIIRESLIEVKKILNVKEIDEYDEYGFTPLIESIVMNKNDIAKFLIYQGANVNKNDLTNRSPLHWAVDNNNIEISSLLLERNADPNNQGSSHPILVQPLLREQVELKKLLIKHGASIEFAYRYIITKLIGHRFDLQGQVHIPGPKKDLILLSFEGFFLEFTISIIKKSLEGFKKHYLSKFLGKYFHKIEHIIECLRHSEFIAKNQHYSANIDFYKEELAKIFSRKSLIIPIVYQGHAITLIRYGEYLAKCDRGYNSRTEGTTVIYKINNINNFNFSFIYNLVYKKHDTKYINNEINNILNLETILTLPVEAQTSGNCSWANVEACIPTLSFLMDLNSRNYNNVEDIINDNIYLYNSWKEWDKDRAIYECIHSFQYEEENIKNASLYAILSAVLFKLLSYKYTGDTERVNIILPLLLKSQKYEYILKSYIEIFINKNRYSLGTNLKNIIYKYYEGKL